LHLARLHESVTWAHRPAVETLDNLAARFASYGSNAQITHRQGIVMAFADVFLLLTLLFIGLAFLAFVLRRPVQLAAGNEH
jgi:MFS transporter, DHA2 family, multidrug resistance protein